MRFKLNLHLFDEAGEASAEATTQEAAAPNAENTETGTPSFKDLIKGQYKEDFDKEVKGILSRRFAKAKQNEDKLTALDPVLRTLSDKYGVGVDDYEGLANAVKGDDTLIEQKALESGLTTEQYRKMSEINYENERLKAQAEAEHRRANAERAWEDMQRQAEEVKKSFPDFDLNTAIQNETFQRLLRAGVDLKSAYISCNADSILSGAMQYTAQEVAKKTAQTIAARGNRPVENALSANASAKAKVDPSKLSYDEVAQYVERARRGEHITFSG